MILIKRSICQRDMVHKGSALNLLTVAENLKASIDYLKRIRNTGTTVRQPDSGRSCSSRSSGGPHTKSGGQSKTHRSAPEILRETGIPHSSVHRIIHRDLQFKCFKQHQAQLLSEANRISRPIC